MKTLKMSRFLQSDQSDTGDSIFAALANPDRVDLASPRDLTDLRLEDMRFPGQVQGKTSTPGSAASHASQRRPASHRSSPRSPVDRFGFGLHTTPRSAGRHFFDRVENVENAGQPAAAPARDCDFFDTSLVSPSTRHRANPPDELGQCDPYAHMSVEEVMMEKQTTLMELERIRDQLGRKLTREYTIQDDLADMKFEVRSHLAQVDEVNTVNFMSNGMKLACQAIELGNNRFGPFLDLDGWATAATSDMSKYQNALGKLYRKYWKRSTMSPELELLLALCGSIAMHHFSKKASNFMFGSKHPATSAVPPPKHTGPAAQPFHIPEANPRAPAPTFTVAASSSTHAPPQQSAAPHTTDMSSDDEEDLPPPNFELGVPDIPDSVPLSAKKRLSIDQ